MTGTQQTISDGLKGSHGPGTTVQAFTSLVLQAPDMHFEAIEGHPDVVAGLDKAGQSVASAAVSGLRGINAHLATAREHANTWKSTLLPLMFTANSDVEGFGHEYVAVTTDLIERLEALGPNPSDVDARQVVNMIERELSALDRAIAPRVATSKQVAEALNNFATQLGADAANFNADSLAVNSVISGDDGLVASLHKEVNALNQAIKKDTAMIAGGSTLMFAGVGVAVVGVLLVATGVGAGVGVALIVGGVLATGAGVALTTIGGIDLKKKRDELVKDQEELSLLQACVTYFNNTLGIVTGLAGSAREAANGADQLHSLWIAQQTGLAEVLQNVKDTEGVAEVTAVALPFLKAARDEWSEAQTAADRIAAALEGLRDNVNTTLYPAAA